MKKKRILSCLLACSMLMTGLTACKQSEEPVKEDDAEVVEQETAANEDYDLHEMVSSYSVLSATTEEIAAVPNETGCPTTQGGYTDGRYFYQAFITMNSDSGEVDNDVVVVKYDMETETIVKQSEKLKLNHCNDFTYNPKTGKLYICNATGRKNIVSIMDPETLTIEGEIDLGFQIFSINYNESRDQYVVGIAGGQTFRLLDANFKIVGEASDYFDPTTRTIGYTTQGNCCDDNYIYFVLFKENVINVYDWDGNFVSWIKLDIPSAGYEPENISVIGNEIYIGGASLGGTRTQVIYKVKTLGPEE